MRRSLAPLPLALALVAAGPATPQEAPPRPTAAPPEFRAGTAVVLLDVVARDKKGRPVLDLRPEEVQVLENGERCDVQSFRLVELERAVQPGGTGGPAGPATPAPVGAGATDATRFPLNLVTLVFDRLDLEANLLARKAALAFVERGMAARTEVAVFKIGQRMALVQKYTNDREALRQAVAAVTTGTDLVDKSLTRDALLKQADAARASGSTMPYTPVGAGKTTSDPSEVAVTGPMDPLQAVLVQTEARALRLADSVQREAEGAGSLYPLLALAKAQAGLPGRKTILFFSAGLQVPENLDEVFRGVISEANRANVSFYAVDARGLQGQSDIVNSAAALRQAATTSMNQQMKGAGEPTTLDEMRIFDTVSDSMRLNLQQTLSDLSEGTGGFLVANANDFARSVDRVAADIRTYYEVTYLPARADFDGSFRKIEVKVERKGVDLQSRRGYFALPPSDRIVLASEVPLLGALAAPSPAHDFEVQAAALHFAPQANGVESAIVVEVPLKTLPFEEDRKKKVYRLRLLAMAAVRDEQGELVERFSDDYPLVVPADQIETVRQSSAVLRRTLPLAPGSYTLETVAMLRDGSRKSVGRQSFEVPVPGSGPALSSLLFIRRSDTVPADAPLSADPFRVEGRRVVPYLEGPVSKAASPNLSFFARIYPVAGGEKPSLRLEFLQDGKQIGQAEPEAPAPDAEGRIAYVVTVPASGFAPGAYQARLTVTQDGATATEERAFELVP